MKNHPITPPPELVKQWWDGTQGAFYEYEAVVIEAARWGADQELKACCEWLEQSPYGFSVTANDVTDQLRAGRRPRPPSLKEESLKSLDEVVNCLKMLVPGASVDGVHIETIRQALEQLPND